MRVPSDCQPSCHAACGIMHKAIKHASMPRASSKPNSATGSALLGGRLTKTRPVAQSCPRNSRQGKRMGRPRVTDRRGFLPRYRAILERLSAGDISRRRAAKELGIGYATLKRLLDSEFPSG